MDYFGKSSEISANFRKLRKRFKPVFEELERIYETCKTSETVQKCFQDVFIIFSLKFSENLRKSSEVFGNLRKRFPDKIGNVCNGSQELKGFGARF